MNSLVDLCLDMLQELRSLADLQEFIKSSRSQGKSIGLVPTMGFLHEGHMSLIKTSKQNTDVTIASIYVNPSQFNESSDFESYPRDEKKDLELLSNHECDAVFIPLRKEMESLEKVSVDLEGLDEVMEGRCRAGHFKGVVEIVYRLFSVVTPNKAFFGEKDYQQLMIVQKMVDQLDLPIQITGVPIVREPNGLAMSSRNSRLSAESREKAGFIFYALKSFHKRDKVEVERELAASGFELEYLEQHELGSESRLFIAGFYEGVRLIDNIEF